MTTAKIATSLIVALLAYATFQLAIAGRAMSNPQITQADCQAFECTAYGPPPSSSLFL